MKAIVEIEFEGVMQYDFITLLKIIFKRPIKIKLSRHETIISQKECTIHNTDFNGKCFKCGEQVFTRRS